MRLSLFIKHLQQLYFEQGDIDIVVPDANKPGLDKAPSLIEIEDAAGKVLKRRPIS